MESVLNLTVIIKHSSISYWRRSVCVCLLDISFQMCSESKVFKINLRLPERWVGLWERPKARLQAGRSYLHRPDPCFVISVHCSHRSGLCLIENSLLTGRVVLAVTSDLVSCCGCRVS